MAAAFNVNLNMNKTNQTSLLALANVEALAQEQTVDQMADELRRRVAAAQVSPTGQW